MMVRRLDRYVFSHFLVSWLTWLFFMVGLMVVCDFVNNADKFTEAWSKLPDEPMLLRVVQYYAVNGIFLFMQLVPIITVTAAMFTVAKLMKCNEITPMIVTGTSVYRVLVPIFVGALGVTVLMVGIRELALPTLRPIKEHLGQIALKGEVEKVRADLFFTDAKGRIVAADSYYSISRKISRLRLISKGHMHDDWQKWEAEEAQWAERGGRLGWWLTKGYRFYPDESGGTVTEVAHFLSPDGLSPDLFDQEIKKNREFFEFSFSELAELVRLRPDYKNYQVLLHYHVTFPLANILLLMLTLPFGFRFERKSTLEGVIMAIVISGLFIVLDMTLRNLGATKVLNPVVAAWSIPVIFGSAGVVLFGSLRT